MALDKASFTYEQTLHVIETNYFFFLSLSLTHLIFVLLSLTNLLPLSPWKGQAAEAGRATAVV